MSEPLKFCKDCAHVEVIDGTHLCACDERVSLVTGEKHMQRTSCTLERATEVAGCGAEGRWWKAKGRSSIGATLFTTVRGLELRGLLGEPLFESDRLPDVLAWAARNNYHIANPS